MTKYFYLLAGLILAVPCGAQVQSRLVGQAQFDYDNTNLIATDTFGYKYSGGRGSDMVTGVYKYDTSVYALGNQLKERNTQDFYYPSLLLHVMVTENYQAGQWQNYRRESYYYNGTGAVDSLLQETWNPFNKIWQNDKRITYTYDAQQKLMLYLEQSWDNLTAYGPYRRIVYAYNGNNIANKAEAFWNSTSAAWEGTEEHRYIYDLNNKLLSDSLQLWDNTNTVWVHEFKTVYTYDGSGRMATVTEKDWDPGTLTTVSDFRHVYVYNAQSQLQYDSLFAWDNGTSAYIKSRLYINGYSGNGNIVQAEEQYIQNDTFRNYRRKQWTYNSHNQPLVYTAQEWDAVALNWKTLFGNDVLINYHYQEYDPTGVADINRNGFALSVYPNPASHIITISTGIVTSTPAEVYIYDYKGALVKKWNQPGMQYNMQVPVQDIAPGTYLLRVQLGDKEMTQHLQIAR